MFSDRYGPDLAHILTFQQQDNIYKFNSKRRGTFDLSLMSSQRQGELGRIFSGFSEVLSSWIRSGGKTWWFCPLEPEHLHLPVSPFLFLDLQQLLQICWVFLSGLGVLSLCLVGERLGEMGHSEVLECEDDLILLGDLDTLELSGWATAALGLKMLGRESELQDLHHMLEHGVDIPQCEMLYVPRDCYSVFYLMVFNGIIILRTTTVVL